MPAARRNATPARPHRKGAKRGTKKPTRARDGFNAVNGTAGVPPLLPVPALAPGALESGASVGENRPTIDEYLKANGKKGTASWYEPNLGGRNGSPNGGSCIGRAKDMPWSLARAPQHVPLLPCGSILVIRGNGKTVFVPVADSGPFDGKADFDLRQGVMDALGGKAAGRIPIEWVQIPSKKKIDLKEYADKGGSATVLQSMMGGSFDGWNPLDPVNDAIDAVGDVASGLDNFFGMLGDVEFWVRAAKFIGGAIIIIIGLGMLGWDVIGGTKGAASAAVKVATKGKVKV